MKSLSHADFGTLEFMDVAPQEPGLYIMDYVCHQRFESLIPRHPTCPNCFQTVRTDVNGFRSSFYKKHPPISTMCSSTPDKSYPNQIAATCQRSHGGTNRPLCVQTCIPNRVLQIEHTLTRCSGEIGRTNYSKGNPYTDQTQITPGRDPPNPKDILLYEMAGCTEVK